jgi:hypothetical protein
MRGNDCRSLRMQRGLQLDCVGNRRRAWDFGRRQRLDLQAYSVHASIQSMFRLGYLSATRETLLFYLCVYFIWIYCEEYCHHLTAEPGDRPERIFVSWFSMRGPTGSASGTIILIYVASRSFHSIEIYIYIAPWAFRRNLNRWENHPRERWGPEELVFELA